MRLMFTASWGDEVTTEFIALCVLELFLELTCKARMMQRRYALLTCPIHR